MRALILTSAAALMLASAASAQVYATSVTAAVPDANGKVPGFNKVPGSAIDNWANGLAQMVLTGGQTYNFCVSLGSAKANGAAGVSWTISRKANVIQNGTIVAPGGLPVGPNGVWYLCSGYTALNSNPGKAVLSGIVTYTPTGGGKTTNSDVHVNVVLK